MNKSNILLFAILMLCINSYAQRRAVFDKTKKEATPTKNSTTTKTTTKNPTNKKETVESAEIENSEKATTTTKIAPNNSKFSSTIELNANPTSSDVSLMNIFGQLALNFHVSDKLIIGPYFSNKITSSHNYETALVDGRSIELGSFKQYGVGLHLSYNLMPTSSVQLIPELRVGYNFYNMEATNFSTDNKAFIDHQYVNATPRLNIGFKLSDYTLLGLNAGYTLPLYIKGDKNQAYNPQSPLFGLFVRFSLPN